VSVPSRKLLLAVLAATAALAASGCGSTSRSPLVARADPICKPVATKRTAVNAALAGKSQTKALEVLAREAPSVAALEIETVDRLRTLKAPNALSNDWQQLLVGMQKLAEDNQKLGAAAKAKNATAVQRVDGEGQQVRQQLTVIATRDGFTYCGRAS